MAAQAPTTVTPKPTTTPRQQQAEEAARQGLTVAQEAQRALTSNVVKK